MANLEVGVGRRSREDSALALLLGNTTGEADESPLSPAAAPGVLHLVVVNSIFGSVSNGKDAVIEVGSASGGEHTGLVQLEGGLVSLDGDGDGLLSKSAHQSSVRVNGHISVRNGGGSSNLGFVGLQVPLALVVPEKYG